MAWSKRTQPADGPEDDRRRRRDSNQDIPYIEASADLGEIPLEELDAFIVPARDDKGGTVRVQFNITPYAYRQLQIAVASRRFPYLAVSDLCRHATIRQINWLMELRNILPPHVRTTMKSIGDILVDLEMEDSINATFARIHAIMTRYLLTGESMEATKLYLRVRYAANNSAAHPWKTSFLATLDHQYGYLIQSTTTSSPTHQHN